MTMLVGTSYVWYLYELDSAYTPQIGLWVVWLAPLLMFWSMESPHPSLIVNVD